MNRISLQGQLLGAAMLLTLQVQAAQADFGACPDIADAAARLACYDALARPAPQAVTGPATPAPMPASPMLPEPLTVDSFGAAQPRLEVRTEGEAELVGKVAEVEELTQGKLRITLTNGQVWRQSVGKSFLLRAQDTVRISRSPWGGTFRLHKDGRPGYIQVERLR